MCGGLRDSACGRRLSAGRVRRVRTAEASQQTAGGCLPGARHHSCSDMALSLARGVAAAGRCLLDVRRQQGEATFIRYALQKKDVDVRVERVLRSMEVALRCVEGSEAEGDVLRFKFGALRLWTGCGLLFFTFHPHVVHGPLLVHFVGADEEHVKRVSLD